MRALISLFCIVFALPLTSGAEALAPAVPAEGEPQAEQTLTSDETERPETPAAKIKFVDRWTGFWRENGTPIFITVAVIGGAIVAHRVWDGRVARLNTAVEPVRPMPKNVRRLDPYTAPLMPRMDRTAPRMPDDIYYHELESDNGYLSGRMGPIELAEQTEFREPIEITEPIDNAEKIEIAESPGLKVARIAERAPEPTFETKISSDYEPLSDPFLKIREKYVYVVDPVQHQTVSVRIADLILPATSVAEDRFYTEVAGQKYVLMHDPLARPSHRDLALARVDSEVQQPTASSGSYFDVHAFDPALLRIEEPFEPTKTRIDEPHVSTEIHNGRGSSKLRNLHTHAASMLRRWMGKP